MEIEITNFNPKHIMDMSSMLCYCTSLKALPDISDWNTEFVTDMSHLFNNCTSLKALPDISKWKTSKVIDMSSMFYSCINLRELPDISNWDVSNVVNFEDMFACCGSLSKLFDDCHSLKSVYLDFKTLEAKELKKLNDMLNNCTSLMEIEIINSNPKHIMDMSSMFCY